MLSLLLLENVNKFGDGCIPRAGPDLEHRLVISNYRWSLLKSAVTQYFTRLWGPVTETSSAADYLWRPTAHVSHFDPVAIMLKALCSVCIRYTKCCEHHFTLFFRRTYQIIDRTSAWRMCLSILGARDLKYVRSRSNKRNKNNSDSLGWSE